MYKPKGTKDIYVDSLQVNSSTLEKQLADRGVSKAEINSIISNTSQRYSDYLLNIVRECEMDMMALEKVPSPLKLFIDCLRESSNSMSLSDSSRKLITDYELAWEEWM